MKRTVWIWELFGFAITAIGGTLLHFLYEWSNKTVYLAPFCGIDESTFEHMKLLFWPMLLYAVIQCIFFESYGNFWQVKLRGVLLGLILIPTLFYTYNGAVGKSPDILNIAIFFIAAAISYVYEARTFSIGASNRKRENVSIAALSVLALSIIVFTFVKPPIGLFADPTK